MSFKYKNYAVSKDAGYFGTGIALARIEQDTVVTIGYLSTAEINEAYNGHLVSASIAFARRGPCVLKSYSPMRDAPRASALKLSGTAIVGLCEFGHFTARANAVPWCTPLLGWVVDPVLNLARHESGLVVSFSGETEPGGKVVNFEDWLVVHPEIAVRADFPQYISGLLAQACEVYRTNAAQVGLLTA